MKIIFKNDSFGFELVRNLGFAYHGGADLGEMVNKANQIMEGDFESWFAGWDKRAQRVLSQAENAAKAGHDVSAREAYQRATTYFRMAEFYLHGNPSDPRILTEAQASASAYAKAAELMGPIWEPIQIPYENTTLPGYFYKVDNSGVPRPTLIFLGGFDSSKEELFYFGAAAAVRRGYNCLTFDGPGQGMPIRDGKLPLRYDWEKIVTPVVDYALTRPDVDGNTLILQGMSLGGYFAARAVAFEHRFKAAIFYDGVYSFYESTRASLPPAAVQVFDAGDRDTFANVIEQAMLNNTNMRWNMTQGKWTFRVPALFDFVEETKNYTIDGTAGQIECPCLVMDAEADMFFKGQPQKIYDALLCPKKLVKTTAEDGAENHCQSGALAFKDQTVFDWLDEILVK
ncbi:alpha/beta hydrolase family protein [Deinococcus marmoris]|uniref:OrfZ protein n=1 Tax=Deinococcus marmoris TaxID=249408 RepID=A0A1U7NTK2_9DEIO|nr:alpha/beta fold hydrolase [Deinococcus marmoris]OLV16235.1 OrfZ protein [Deinococcus marmoris]